MMRRFALPLVPLHDPLDSLLPYNKISVESKDCPYPSVPVIEIIGIPDHPLDLLFNDLIGDGRLWPSSLTGAAGSILLHPIPGCPGYVEHLADHRDRVRGVGEFMDDFFLTSSI